MNKKLRVWHIPQIPMKPFYVKVKSIEEGAKILTVLADYDLFQYKNNIKPDYSNMGGLQEFDEEGWSDWYNDDGEDIWDLIDLEKIEY